MPDKRRGPLGGPRQKQAGHHTASHRQYRTPVPLDPAAAHEAASALDRRYFELHPGEDDWHRWALPGEFLGMVTPPAPAARLAIHVVQHAPGIRTRHPYWIVGEVAA